MIGVFSGKDQPGSCIFSSILLKGLFSKGPRGNAGIWLESVRELLLSIASKNDRKEIIFTDDLLAKMQTLMIAK